MKNNVAIILARGGSKGIPKKNIMNFCGKPLVAWSIEQAKTAYGISSVWISSDSNDILDVAKKYGAKTLLRPKALSKDTSSTELGYLHALKEIEKNDQKVDAIVALQATSPIRESSDIEKGIKEFEKLKCDSLFSGALIGDFLIWERVNQGKLRSINYNYQKRPRRQKFSEQFVENGSFYIFKPEILKKYNNRLGGKIGIAKMEFWKSFELDEKEDIELCELIMKHYLLKKRKNKK